MARSVVGFADLARLAGRGFTSEWRAVTQEAVGAFAHATGDHQWIHVDPERASRESPFGGTIAHGYMSLALVPGLLFATIEVTGTRLVINYGANKIRSTGWLQARRTGRTTCGSPPSESRSVP
jgi:acyl dehydratase